MKGFKLLLTLCVIAILAALYSGITVPSLLTADTANAASMPTPPAAAPAPTATQFPSMSPEVMEKLSGAPVGYQICEVFGNRDVSGSPEQIVVWPELNANWGLGGPLASALFIDQWSLRCTSRLITSQPEILQITYQTDDGVRIYVDGKRVLDAWTPGAHVGTIHIPIGAGQHTLQVEYFDANDRAYATVHFEQSCFGWIGRVYRNTDFSGTPDMLLCAASANADLVVDLGDSRLTGGAALNNTSVQWERTVQVNQHDVAAYLMERGDGLQIWIDGNLEYSSETSDNAPQALHLIWGTHQITVRQIYRGNQAKLVLRFSGR